MRIVELSDHPGELLEQERQRREDAQERAQAQFERRRSKHQARVRRARQARDDARAQHRWLTWLRGIVAVRREQREAPRPPAPLPVTAAEEILAAGVHGEGIVTRELGQALGGEWTLLRGYHNRLGEIDHLLLGPTGLVAIEVKYRNATVHCDGDTWWYDKYDRAGHLVERGQQLADNRGRSPSVQLNQPAGLLEDFLRARGHGVPVQRVVLFTHAQSRLGGCRNRTVHIATSTGYVLDLVRKLPGHLDARELGQLERLILRNHDRR